MNKYHEEYEAEIKRNKGRTKYDYKRKKHVPIKPKCGYLAKAVREFYTDLAVVAKNDPIFNKALKVASRVYENSPKLPDPCILLRKLERLGEVARLNLLRYEKRFSPGFLMSESHYVVVCRSERSNWKLRICTQNGLHRIMWRLSIGWNLETNG